MTVFSDSGTAELEQAEWHREQAKRTFNAAWELIDEPARSPEQDRRMLVLACASRAHWDQAGGPREHAIGDWQVGHVLTLLGDGPLALSFARQALATVEAQGWTDFTLASAYEGVARAYAALGDKAERDEYAAKCRTALEALPPEDQEVIAGQLATVPEL
ncbi:hypothetical protein GCM10009839_55640 [Catenulispora yoronensis]|uniref:Tetratricopeptide repeat protein n=1 Tax=Catenulispora yoronensis TaxID=450799 RepID=A0ABP5GHT6_9ACTN